MPPSPCISNATRAGVTMMPSRLEKDALHTAAATLPRAMAVKAIEDCTVEGSKVRNSMPAAAGPPRNGSAASPRPKTGNRMKVTASTARCSRQCRTPS